jgi:hypothetical protein
MRAMGGEEENVAMEFVIRYTEHCLAKLQAPALTSAKPASAAKSPVKKTKKQAGDSSHKSTSNGSAVPKGMVAVLNGQVSKQCFQVEIPLLAH